MAVASAISRLARGNVRNVALNRLDHLSVYADEKGPLWRFLDEVLELPVVIPRTKFAFGYEGDIDYTSISSLLSPGGGDEIHDIEFEVEMAYLGSGCGIDVYEDASLGDARRDRGLPATTMAHLTFEAGDGSLHRLHNAIERYQLPMDPYPIVYHFPEEQLQADPSLPKWLFRRHTFGLSTGLWLSHNSVSAMARAEDHPGHFYTSAILWHRDFQFHPRTWRRDDLHLAHGALRVVGCPRVLATLHADENDLGILMQVCNFLKQGSLRRLSAREAQLDLGRGPAVHFTVDTAGSEQHRAGRVTGVELAVEDLEGALQTLSDRSPEVAATARKLGRSWGVRTRPHRDDRRVVVDLSTVGGGPLDLHLVPAMPVARNLLCATERALRAIEREAPDEALARLSTHRRDWAGLPEAPPPAAAAGSLATPSEAFPFNPALAAVGVDGPRTRATASHEAARALDHAGVVPKEAEEGGGALVAAPTPAPALEAVRAESPIATVGGRARAIDSPAPLALEALRSVPEEERPALWSRAASAAGSALTLGNVVDPRYVVQDAYGRDRFHRHSRLPEDDR